MDARKTAWDRLMTYRFEDADSDRLSMETIDALTYARDMLATQQARIDELEKASNTAVADYKRCFHSTVQLTAWTNSQHYYRSQPNEVKKESYRRR